MKVCEFAPADKKSYVQPSSFIRNLVAFDGVTPPVYRALLRPTLNPGCFENAVQSGVFSKQYSSTGHVNSQKQIDLQMVTYSGAKLPGL